MTAKKISQSDLRRLMSAHKKKTVEKVKRIESPLAKYSDSGQLSCILCNSVIRSDSSWTIHVSSKDHRDNIARKKPSAPPPPPSPATTPILGKRITVIETEVPAKKPKGILKNAPKLPDNFFDNAAFKAPGEANALNGSSLPSEDTEEPMETTPTGDDPQAGSSELPEGFFDNPLLDAKARNVEYVNPVDEEWEKFQREIKEETSVSARIIQDELEDVVTQRQIEEIDEQMSKLSKVVELEQKKEKIIATVQSRPKPIKEESSTSDEDSDDIEMEFDWRAKSFLS